MLYLTNVMIIQIREVAYLQRRGTLHDLRADLGDGANSGGAGRWRLAE